MRIFDVFSFNPENIDFFWFYVSLIEDDYITSNKINLG